MALINCPECQSQISTKATSCPNCGNAPEKKGGGAFKIFLILAWFGFLFYVFTPSERQTASAPARPAFTVQDRSPAAQDRRIKLINNLIDQGIFHKVQFMEIPRIYIGPKFHSLLAEDKKSFAGVVIAYNHVATGQGDFVVFVNPSNDQRVGSYSPTLGLDLD